MLPGVRSNEGVLYTITGVPPANASLVGGIAVSPTGRVYTTATVAATDVYPNGFRVSALGQLVLNVEGIARNLQEGIARGSDGRTIVTPSAPNSTSQYIGGLRVSATGMVHYSNSAPPVVGGFDTGFNLGFEGESGVVPPVSPPFSIFGNQSPSGYVDIENSSEIGVVFIPAIDCEAVGIKWQRGQNINSVDGHLWDRDTGAMLPGSKVAMGMTGINGWSYGRFVDPIPLTAGKEYVISIYFAAQCIGTAGYFSVPHVNGDLTATTGIAGDGISMPSIETQTNYWIDVSCQTQ